MKWVEILVFFVLSYSIYVNIQRAQKYCYRQGPAQDVPFDLILWYIAKIIPILEE